MDQRSIGWLALVVGLVGAALALTMNTTVSSEYGSVNNIGLIKDQQNYLIFSGLIAMAGLGLVLTAQTAPAEVPSGLRECPECAERIQARAKKCRYCGTEVEPLVVGQIIPPNTEDLSDESLQWVADFYEIKPANGGYDYRGTQHPTLRDAVAAARSGNPEVG